MTNLNAPGLAATSHKGENIIKLPHKNSTKPKYTVIPVDDQYRITGCRYSWDVEKTRKRGKKEVWEAISYHGKLDTACNSLWDLMVRTSGAQGVAEILLVQEISYTKLSRALSCVAEIEFHSDG